MADCNSCKENTERYYAEITASRLEKANIRQFIVIVILILALIGSNLAWLYYESQFEDVTTEQKVVQEADNGENHFIGSDVVGKTDNNNKNP